MTEKLERFEATINLASTASDGLTITVREEDPTCKDYTCGPGIDLDLTICRDGLTIDVTESMDEDEVADLIDALRDALKPAREHAQAAGYYQWLADGKPSYGPPYAYESDPTISESARAMIDMLHDRYEYGSGGTVKEIAATGEIEELGAERLLSELVSAGYVEAYMDAPTRYRHTKKSVLAREESR